MTIENFYMISNDSRKKEFVAVRMEQDLFVQLKSLAQKRNLDLSSIVRDLCREGLLESG